MVEEEEAENKMEGMVVLEVMEEGVEEEVKEGVETMGSNGGGGRD